MNIKKKQSKKKILCIEEQRLRLQQLSHLKYCKLKDRTDILKVGKKLKLDEKTDHLIIYGERHECPEKHSAKERSNYRRYTHLTG